MTDKELIDRFLTGELDEAGMAQLEGELKANPELVRELSEQQNMEQALKVLLGDDTGDQQVTVSVLSVIRADSVDQFKTELMARVKREDDLRRREDEKVRQPAVEKTESGPVPLDPAPVRLARPGRGRRYAWGLGGALAASALMALGAALFTSGPQTAAPSSKAFLLAASAGVKVQRAHSNLPARIDMVLEPGDQLIIDEGGDARIGFADDTTRIHLKGPAALRYKGGPSKQVELLRGEFEAALPQQAEGFRAVTPFSEMQIQEGQVRLLSAKEFARVEVTKGAASFTRVRDRKSVRVEADQYAVAGKDVDLVAKALNRQAPALNGPGVIALVQKVQGGVFLFTKSTADRTPAQAGQAILEDQAILTEGSRSLAVLDYPDHTRLEIGPDTVVRRLTDEKDRTRKHVVLDQGTLSADVTKQAPGKSMILKTPNAEANVLGTRFTLSAEKESTKLQVEEGAVSFTRAADKKTITVHSGYFAVVAPGKPLDPALQPGGIRYLNFDLTQGIVEGDGDWVVEGRKVHQKKVSRLAEGGTATMLFKTQEEQGVVLEATVDVDQVTPDAAGWGFGLEAIFRNRTIVLRSHQEEGNGLFEFFTLSNIPFEHGREGTYHLKLSIERRGPKAVLDGKIWQGDREPDGWMIENVIELEGPLTQVGLQSVRSACTFRSFRVRVLKEEKR